MAANGPHVNHEGEILSFPIYPNPQPEERGGRDDDDDDDDRSIISSITMGTEWNTVTPSSAAHDNVVDGDDPSSAVASSSNAASSSRIDLGADYGARHAAMGVNINVPDRKSKTAIRQAANANTNVSANVAANSTSAAAGTAGARRSTSHLRDRIGGFTGAGGVGSARDSGAHPLWGGGGGGAKAKQKLQPKTAATAIGAANYMVKGSGTGNRRAKSADRAMAVGRATAAADRASDRADRDRDRNRSKRRSSITDVAAERPVPTVSAAAGTGAGIGTGTTAEAARVRLQSEATRARLQSAAAIASRSARQAREDRQDRQVRQDTPSGNIIAAASALGLRVGSGAGPGAGPTRAKRQPSSSTAGEGSAYGFASAHKRGIAIGSDELDVLSFAKVRKDDKDDLYSSSSSKMDLIGADLEDNMVGRGNKVKTKTKDKTKNKTKEKKLLAKDKPRERSRDRSKVTGDGGGNARDRSRDRSNIIGGGKNRDRSKDRSKIVGDGNREGNRGNRAASRDRGVALASASPAMAATSRTRPTVVSANAVDNTTTADTVEGEDGNKKNDASMSMNAFSNMFAMTSKQGSGRTAGYTTGTTTDHDDSSSMFDAGALPPSAAAAAAEATSEPLAAQDEVGIGASGYLTTATGTATAASAAPNNSQIMNESNQSFASFTSSKFPTVATSTKHGFVKTTGLDASLSSSTGNFSFRQQQQQQGTGGRHIAKSDDKIMEEEVVGAVEAANMSSPIFEADDDGNKNSNNRRFRARRRFTGDTDIALAGEDDPRRRSSGGESAWDIMDSRVEEILTKDEADVALAAAAAPAVDKHDGSTERHVAGTATGDSDDKNDGEGGVARDGSGLAMIQEQPVQYKQELAPPAEEGVNSKPLDRRPSGGSSGGSAAERSRGSLTVAMAALGLDNSNSELAEQAEGEGDGDGVGGTDTERNPATRPGAVYDRNPAPSAYHYQAQAQARPQQPQQPAATTVSRPPPIDRRSAGRGLASTRSRADVLGALREQEAERVAERAPPQNEGGDQAEPRSSLALSDTVDLDAILAITAAGGVSGASTSQSTAAAAQFLEEQRAAMERFSSQRMENNQEHPGHGSGSGIGADSRTNWRDVGVADVSSSDGFNTDMTTAGMNHPNRPLIEISPGRFEFLRGSEETWMAIKSNNYAAIKCTICETELRCVADADMVICPDCRVVSPLEEGRGTSADGFSEGGVGLGVKVSDLAPNIQRRLGIHT